MSIANKLVTIAENMNKVYEAGKNSVGNIEDIYNDGYEAGYAKAESVNPFYYANVLESVFQGATFPENTDVVLKVKKAPTRCTSLFQNATNIKSIKLISEDTSNVISGSGMFRGNTKLELIDLTEFNRKFSNGQYFLLGNKKLKSILGALDVSGCTSFSSAFNTDNGVLEDIEFVPNTIKYSIGFEYCPNLTHDSLMSIINGLAVVETTRTLTLGTTNLNKLTDEEKAIATEKGWTLA